MSRKDQINQELQRLLPLIIERFQPALVLLFGSAASGEVEEWSDLDVVVVRETPLRFMDRLGELIDNLKPRVGVDFLVYTPDEWAELTRSNAFVRDEILGKGKVLHAA
jgi:predicted nucleotidyltransferase